MYNNDIIIVADENENLVQKIKIAFLSCFNESIISPENGLPYTQFILQSNDQKKIFAVVHNYLMKIDGVEKINSLEIKVSNRVLSIEFSVNEKNTSTTIEVNL